MRAVSNALCMRLTRGFASYLGNSDVVARYATGDLRVVPWIRPMTVCAEGACGPWAALISRNLSRSLLGTYSRYFYIRKQSLRTRSVR